MFEELRKVQPVDIELKNVSLTVRSKSMASLFTKGSMFSGLNDVQVLKNISAKLPPGQLIAIMGGSGSGKTSLLNAMAGRITGSSAVVSGDILYHGKSLSEFDLDKIGYVAQSDFLMPHLTVRETLRYAAALRLSGNVSAEQRAAQVEAVIMELGLKECADTRIGNDRVRGCSGGEKRRVSIAVQLLTNPSVLFLDEPTSGLDAFTAHTLIETLSKLTAQGRTVVVSIHQPRSDIFHLFDSLILVSKGRLAFTGDCNLSLDYFASKGFVCPDLTNPADFLLDVTSIDNRSPEAEKESKERVTRLLDAWASDPHPVFSIKQKSVEFSGVQKKDQPQNGEISTNQNQEQWTVVDLGEPSTPSHQTTKNESEKDISNSHNEISKKSRANLWQQFAVLCSRSFKNQSRDRLNVYGSLMESVIMAIFAGGIYWQLDKSLAGIRSRTAFLYSTVALQPYLVIIFCIQKIVTEMKVFDRERSDRMYTPISYILSEWVSSAPLNFFFPTVYSLIVYGMAGLDWESRKFAVFWAVCIATQYISIAFAWFAVSLQRDFAMASLFANSIYTFMGLSCGYFIQIDSIPIYLRWIKHISFVFYPFRLLASNEFSGEMYDCPQEMSDQWTAALTAQGIDPATYTGSNPLCTPYTGEYILTALGFSEYDWTTPSVALAIFFIVFVLLSIVFISILVVPTYDSAPPTSGEKDKNDSQLSYPIQPSAPEKRSFIPVTVSLHSLHLSLVPNHLVAKIRRKFHKNNSNSHNHSEFPSDVSHEHEKKLDMARVSTMQVLSAAEEDIEIESQSKPKTKNQNLSTEQKQSAVPASGTHGKPILRGIEATFKPGRLVVIMGASGCGKSTLLNHIAQRNNFGVLSSPVISGSVKFEGKEISVDEMKSMCSYVMQSDHLLPSLTVRETLHYAALLRLPRELPREAKIQRAESVLLELGLKDCADTIVGNEVMKGISGGEKRRVSIAAQMLTDPSVLLLDEPTTGLDAFSAYNLMKTLKSLASENRTVVCTLHQPRSDLFTLFDDVLLMAKGGYQVYFGPGKDILSYFETLGHVCPRDANPADFFIDLASIDLRNEKLEKESRARVMRLWEAFKQYKPSQLADSTSSSQNQDISPSLSHSGSSGAPLFLSLPLLLSRSVKNFTRQPLIAITRISQIVALGVIFTLFFAPFQGGYYGIMNRVGLLQELTALLFVGMLNNVAIFPEERNVFYREYADGAYSTLSFFLSYLFIELPFEIISSFLVCLLFTFVVGLKTAAVEFMVLVFVVFCFVNAGEAIGIMFCSVVYHTGFSVSLTSSALSLFTLMSGLMSLNMSDVLNGINYISVIKYGTRAVFTNEFEDMTFSCDPDKRLLNGDCGHPVTGQQVLELFNFSTDTSEVALMVGITAVVVVLYRVVAYLMLWASAKRGPLVG